MKPLDPSASNADHVAAIHKHLKSLDSDLGPLLAAHLTPDALATLDERGRKQLRAQIAAEAKKYLDNLPIDAEVDNG